MNELLHRHWQEAIEKNKCRLSEEDRLLAERFRTPDAILEDLERRQAERQNSWFGHVRDQVAPFLKSMQSLSTMLVIAMLPHSIETSLAWGILSLIFHVGLPSLSSPRLPADQTLLVGVCYRGTFPQNDGDIRRRPEGINQGEPLRWKRPRK